MSLGLVAISLPLLVVFPLFAQPTPSAHSTNSAGESLFLSECAFCHGTNATGGRGPNLLGPLVHSDSPAALEKVIKEGVPGTPMPSFDFEPEEIAALISYLKSLRHGNGSTAPVPGDPVAGRAVYVKQACASCHRVNLDGSVFGPDLSRVGGARSYAYLKESILNPSADVPEFFRTVRVVTSNGETISGLRANEDSFTLQLRLLNQSFRSFDKSTLQKVDYPAESLMPRYRLSEPDLTNLLAYLSTLRIDPADPSTKAAKAEGVH